MTSRPSSVELAREAVESIPRPVAGGCRPPPAMHGLRRRRHRPPFPERRAVPVALLALAIGAFGIGTTEFVMMGVLPEAAADFGVSIPTAGHLIAGYALGVVIGAPLLTAFAVRLPRKTM